MKPFEQLTYQGQTRRLRQLAINALTQYDLDVTRVSLIQAYFNAIYRVDTADGTKYVIRVSLPHHRTPDEIQAEALWLAALRRDCNQPVPTPHLNRAGELVTLAEAPGVSEPRRCIVFSWVPGPNLSECLTPPNYEKLGRLMAEFHQHAATFHLPETLRVKCFNKVFPFNEPIRLFDESETAHLNTETQTHARTIIDKTQIMLDRLLSTGEAPRLIHADLHQWNVKVYQDKLYAIDFDDTMVGYPVQDIGIALYYLYHRDDFPALYGAFRRGYEALLPWPERFHGEVETWMAWRAMDLLNYMIVANEMKDEPSFFKHLVGQIPEFADVLRAYDTVPQPV